MKIAIVGYPRTNSTHLGCALSKIHSLEFVGDVLDPGVMDLETGLALLAKDNVIVKFLGNIIRSNFNFVDWTQFDEIYITTRNSIIDCAASFHVARAYNKFHRNKLQGNIGILTPTPFELSQIEIDKFKSFVLDHRNIVAQLQVTVPDRLQYVPFSESSTNPVFVTADEYLLPNNLDYSKLCLNYAAIEQQLNEEGWINDN